MTRRRQASLSDAEMANRDLIDAVNSLTFPGVATPADPAGTSTWTDTSPSCSSSGSRSPVRVVVAVMVCAMPSWLISGRSRQSSRCRKTSLVSSRGHPSPRLSQPVRAGHLLYGSRGSTGGAVGSKCQRTKNVVSC